MAESILQESIKLGDWKLGRVPEIKKFSHRLDEHRTETRETRVIDYFSVSAH